MLTKQLRIEGFQARQFYGLMEEYWGKMNGWLDSGACKYTETISDGLESFPAALITMLEGKNLGKQLVQVSADPLATDLAGGDAVSPEATGAGGAVVDAPSTSALRLLQDFIQTPSISPDHAPGAPPNKFGVISGTAGLGDEFGELRMAEAVRTHFEALGAEVHWDEVIPGRPGVYGVFRATEGDPAERKWLGVEVHMDTVGVQTAVEPFGATVDADGKLHGRGSCDTKVGETYRPKRKRSRCRTYRMVWGSWIWAGQGYLSHPLTPAFSSSRREWWPQASLATALDVLYHAKATGQRLRHNLVITGSIDEETGPLGAKQFARWLEKEAIVIDELLIAEPTSCVPIHGHKGGVLWRMAISARHAAPPLVLLFFPSSLPCHVCCALTLVPGTRRHPRFTSLQVRCASSL